MRLLLLITAFCGPLTNFAQQKVGKVSVHEVLETYQPYKAQLQQLDRITLQYQLADSIFYAHLDEQLNIQIHDNCFSIHPEEDENNLEAEHEFYQEIEEKIRLHNEESTATLNQKRDSIINGVMISFTKELENFATTYGYSSIVDQLSLHACTDCVNVTKEFIEYLHKEDEE